jgi:hypothetical protein
MVLISHPSNVDRHSYSNPHSSACQVDLNGPGEELAHACGVYLIARAAPFSTQMGNPSTNGIWTRAGFQSRNEIFFARSGKSRDYAETTLGG